MIQTTLKKKARKIVLAAAFLFTLGSAITPASAQVSGTTDVDITLNPLIILFYFGNVDVTISDTDLAGVVLSPNTNPVDEGTAPVSGFSDNLGVDGTTNFTSPTTVNLDLLSSWAVRAVGNGNDVRVSVNTTCGGCDTTLEHSTTPANTIDITGVQIDTSGGAFGSSQVDITPAGLGTAIVGDIRVILDLTGAGLSGVYEDGVFEISAVSL